jgi:DNA-binding response OmpR family regulator
MDILLVEDEPEIATLIAHALNREGLGMRHALGLAQARQAISTQEPSLILVDLGLADGSGLQLVREVAGQGIFIMVVSGQGDELDRVLALELGADDFVVKPFSPRELVARVRALMRRAEPRLAAAAPRPSAPAPFGPQTLGGVLLDPVRMRLAREDGAETRLTAAEAGLLDLLLRHRGQVVERDEVAKQVLGRRLLPQQRGVDQLASALRQKLTQMSDGRIEIISVRGRGYRLVA